MAEKRYYLTERDRKRLDDLLDRFQRQVVNTTGRPGPPPDDHTAPEVYIALTPSDGLPGLGEETGTGTGTAEGEGATGTGSEQTECTTTPGSAQCYIYRILQDPTEPTCGPSLQLVDVFPKTVYNVYTEDIPGNTYIVVWRDKFGSWVTGAPHTPLPSIPCELMLPLYRYTILGDCLYENLWYNQVTFGAGGECDVDSVGPVSSELVGCFQAPLTCDPCGSGTGTGGETEPTDPENCCQGEDVADVWETEVLSGITNDCNSNPSFPSNTCCDQTNRCHRLEPCTGEGVAGCVWSSWWLDCPMNGIGPCPEGGYLGSHAMRLTLSGTTAEDREMTLLVLIGGTTWTEICSGLLYSQTYLVYRRTGDVDCNGPNTLVRLEQGGPGMSGGCDTDWPTTIVVQPATGCTPSGGPGTGTGTHADPGTGGSPECGSSAYIWNGLEWIMRKNDCEGGGDPSPPPDRGTFDGEIRYVECDCPPSGGEGWYCVSEGDPPAVSCQYYTSDPPEGATGPYDTEEDCYADCSGILSVASTTMRSGRVVNKPRVGKGREAGALSAPRKSRCRQLKEQGLPCPDDPKSQAKPAPVPAYPREPVLVHPPAKVVWSCGVTTVESRRRSYLPSTLASLRAGGFADPTLFVDGGKDPQLWEAEFGLVTYCRPNQIGVVGAWLAALHELYYANPRADRFALFQDDLTCSKNLKAYLERSPWPNKGYCNLYTFTAGNERAVAGKGVGWHEAGLVNPPDRNPQLYQTGRGAVALVFDREAVMAALSSPHLVHKPSAPGDAGRTKIDGALVTAMNAAGFREYVHQPSLVQHQGHLSSRPEAQDSNSGAYRYGHMKAQTYRGDDFDCLELLGVLSENTTSKLK